MRGCNFYFDLELYHFHFCRQADCFIRMLHIYRMYYVDSFLIDRSGTTIILGCFLTVCCCCRPHPSTEKMVKGSNKCLYAHPHLTEIRACLLTGVLLHSTRMWPTSTGAVHNSVTFSCGFMLVQLNKCVVVCGSDLQRGHSGDG